MGRYTDMSDKLFGHRPDDLSADDLDHAAQRSIFIVMGCIFAVLIPIYLTHLILTGRYGFAVLLGAAACALVGGALYAFLTNTFVWPLRSLLGSLCAGLAIGALNQGPDLPASGWWLSIIPFIFAAAGMYRMAIASVVVFLAVVATLHLGAAGYTPRLPVTDDVELWRRITAVAGSEVIALALIIVSMRNRQRLVRALDGAREAATEAGAIKARFLANMSHEIRTPLTGIIGVADVLGSPGISESQRRQLLELQRQSASTLLALVNNILDASKLDAGQLTLESRPLDLRQVIFEANELFSMQAFGKGIELSSSCNPNVPQSFVGDAIRLRQVVNNLVGNAVKFTTKGGVHIHASVDPIVDVHASTRSVVIEIVDTGPGIAKEQQELLFRPFIQADETVARQYGGTGLGLSIAAELAKLMGGSIRLVSEIGQGTTFTVALPLAIDSPETDFDVPKLRPDVVAAVNSRGLERHLKAVLHDLRVAPVMHTRLPEERELAGCEILLIDAPLLSIPDPQEWITRQANAGRQVVILTPLGVDAVAGVLRDAMIIYKPVRRSALELVLNGEASTSLIPDATEGKTSPLAGLRVLLVDDNPVNQVVVQAMLLDLGADASVATDGVEATQAAATQRFDLILMDVNMPRMDGLTATRVIRTRESQFNTPRVTVIAMTAATEGEDGQACAEAGMDGFLEKPFSMTQLQNALGRLAMART